MAKGRRTLGVAVIIVNKDYDILLGKRIGKKRGNNMWQFPGGHHETYEYTPDTAIRETKEETNLDIDIPWFINFFEEIEEENNHHTTFFYMARLKEDSAPLENVEPDKCAGWEWFKISQLPDKIFEVNEDILEDIVTAVRLVIMNDEPGRYERTAQAEN